MIVQREDMVNSLISKENKNLEADVSLDDVSQLLDNFKKAFEVDMLNSDVEKFIEKYSIESPFDEITESVNTQDDRKTKRNITLENGTTGKRDPTDIKRFSTKYMTTLNKIMEKNAKENPAISENKTETKWIAADEEWKKKTKSFIKDECKVDITWPDGFYDNIKRSYAIQGLRKKMPWISLSKTTAKVVSDRFKKGRMKENLRGGLTQREVVVEEEILEPPSWDEAEKMREKCIEWLTHHGRPAE